jgi:hypothetical protein
MQGASLTRLGKAFGPPRQPQSYCASKGRAIAPDVSAYDRGMRCSKPLVLRLFEPRARPSSLGRPRVERPYSRLTEPPPQHSGSTGGIYFDGRISRTMSSSEELRPMSCIDRAAKPPLTSLVRSKTSRRAFVQAHGSSTWEALPHVAPRARKARSDFVIQLHGFVARLWLDAPHRGPGAPGRNHHRIRSSRWPCPHVRCALSPKTGDVARWKRVSVGVVVHGSALAAIADRVACIFEHGVGLPQQPKSVRWASGNSARPRRYASNACDTCVPLANICARCLSSR